MIHFFVVFLASILVALSYNLFLLPHKILSSGVSGIAMILGLITPVNTGLANFLLNLPILIVGFMKLGKRFMFLTIFAVFVISVSMLYIPLHAVAKDPLLSSVFGGVISGAGVGMAFRFSASTGGFDIVGLLLTRKKDFHLGVVLFAMNAVVVFISGFLFGWDSALYTLVSIYASAKVIDVIHTRHVKLTLMIITSKGEEIRDRLLATLVRGITVMEGEGAFSKEKRKILFTVISRYELSEIKPLIKNIDSHAFVNIMETVEVMGVFRKE